MAELELVRSQIAVNTVITRLSYAILFVPFAIVLGEVIHRRGRLVVEAAFPADTAVAAALSALLRIGWYLLCTGLLLWNIGTEGDVLGRPNTLERTISEVAFRLGVSIFVVALMHGLNILALSLFHRKKT